MERYVGERVLKVKRLSNELRDLQRAFMQLRVPKSVTAELPRLYRLRSDQVMHAQKKQEEFQEDDVMVMKVALDAVLHQIYQPVWEKKLEGFIARHGM